MKTILRTSLFITVLILSVFAQSEDNLKVWLEQNSDNNKPVILNVNIQTGIAISRAVFIELPAGLKPVLLSAQLGDKTLWLINSKKEITKDNVIGWYAKDNGLILHYTDSIIQNNNLLEIKLVPDRNRLQRFDKVDVKVYPVSNSGEDFIVQKSILSQSDVSVKKVEKDQ